MTVVTDAELNALADDLYDRCGDDDAELARLMHELDPAIAIRLCTSDLTNAAQVYMYAFNEIPDEEIYDLLLLQPASQLLRGVSVGTVELAELVMGFDKTKNLFFIGVWNGEKFVAAFAGEESYDRAAAYARKNCSA
ncbi:hypothetical protein [Methanorbis furvi]|uniref:Uncharacterized protein n=1 Tax=Methanorbis furvi TaxID=3028299 RepID=A0AAE4MBX0_9EURY|nr:hypothetical protein [Methanocorpusculaceae archaeon Ag1]